MKTPLKIMMLMLTVCLFSCGQEDELIINPKTLSGEWTYEADESVIFDFYDAELMKLDGQDYSYQIEDNILTLQYAGQAFILLPPTEHRIRVTKDVIWLDNLEEIWFFDAVADEGILKK